MSASIALQGKTFWRKLRGTREHLPKPPFGHNAVLRTPEGEGPDRYCVCCDRAKNCDCDGPPSSAAAAKSEPVYFV